MSVGAHLRALRDARQGGLEEMARATRVSVYQLEALEADRFSDLPAPVFVKGFIRAYCQFLAEPADEALRRYGEVLGRDRPPEPPRPARRPIPAWIGSPVFLSVALIVIFGAALLLMSTSLKQQAQVAPPRRPAARLEPASPASIPAAALSSEDPSSENPGPQRLLVRAIEPTWIRIQTDDLHAVQELLPPGATREWTAEKRFLLTVGNAGGIEIELNGRRMPRLGESGTVIRQLELPQAAAAGS
jgi:cytoskeleton protein RodZ